MPIRKKFKSNNRSFSESFYYDNFIEEQRKLSHHLSLNPNDEGAKEKIRWIDNLLKEENKSKWPAAWINWEKGHYFYWPVDND